MKKQMYFIIAILTLVMFASCDGTNWNNQQKSDSGVTKATVQVKTDENGNTVEQRNVMERIKRDNEIGSVKHLYVVSSYTGDVMEYSTVQGKVTSGGKRINPKTVQGNGFDNAGASNLVYLGGVGYTTDEVIDDGGTYGESGQYLYWFDAQGNYHQYYPSGGTYLHISDKPLKVRKSNLSIEVLTD